MIRINVYFLACILLMGNIHQTLAKATIYSLQLTRLKCEEVDPRLTYNYSCSSRYLDRTTKVFSAQMHLHPNVSLDNVFVKISAYLKTNNVFRRTFIDTEEDFCGFQSGKKAAPLISILWPVFKRVGNIKDRCPHTGILRVTDAKFDENFLPPFLPEGEALLVIHIRNGPNRISLIKGSLFVEIKPKGANTLILR